MTNAPQPTPSNQTGPTATLIQDPVLLSAWATMTAYDERAKRLKRDFVNRRRQVILFSLAATCFSSLSALLAAFNIATPFSTIFAILGIILATVLTFLRDDVNEFSRTTTWINLRNVTEAMRSEIFLYRMRAGTYRDVPDVDADDLLSAAIQKLEETLGQDNSGQIAVTDSTSAVDQLDLLLKTGQIAEGEVVQKDLAFDRYKTERMDQQKSWYDGKVINDYEAHKRRARASRAAMGIGAVIAAVGLAGSPQFSVVISITTALSVAITSDSNVNMFGKTYSIFQTAAQELSNLNRDWLAKQNNAELADAARLRDRQRAFVEAVEGVAKRERESWYQMVVNIQTISDGTIIPSGPRNQTSAASAQPGSGNG